MSNIKTKNCDHKNCEKLYHNDTNNWWWAFRYKQIIIFAQFSQDLILHTPDHTNSESLKFVKEGMENFKNTSVLNKDTDEVLHFCGQEHLMSWVNENVGRIVESANTKPTTD